jgi:hypothetical protein
MYLSAIQVGFRGGIYKLVNYHSSCQVTTGQDGHRVTVVSSWENGWKGIGKAGTRS